MRRVRVGATALAGVVLTGCGGTASSPQPPTSSASSGTSSVTALPTTGPCGTVSADVAVVADLIHGGRYDEAETLRRLQIAPSVLFRDAQSARPAVSAQLAVLARIAQQAGDALGSHDTAALATARASFDTEATALSSSCS